MNNPTPDLDSLAFLAVNEAAIQRYGCSRAEFLDMTIEDIRPSEDLPRLEANLAERSQRFQTSGWWRHRKKDGNIIEVERPVWREAPELSADQSTIDHPGSREDLVERDTVWDVDAPRDSPAYAASRLKK